MLHKNNIKAKYYLCKVKINTFMKRSHIFSFIISFLLFWAICYVFNSVALIGKLVFAKAFISPWLTYTSVMKYLSIGMGVEEWLAYTLAALLLLFLLISIYFFVFSLLRAVQYKATR